MKTRDAVDAARLVLSRNDPISKIDATNSEALLARRKFNYRTTGRKYQQRGPGDGPPTHSAWGANIGEV
ncbi:MAG: hypothetical protein AAGB02_02425 [Pseudomonadota bacterium]